jgi:hypothetical protein
VIEATIYLTELATFQRSRSCVSAGGSPNRSTRSELKSLALPGLLIEIDVTALAGDGEIVG